MSTSLRLTNSFALLLAKTANCLNVPKKKRERDVIKMAILLSVCHFISVPSELSRRTNVIDIVRHTARSMSPRWLEHSEPPHTVSFL